MENFAISHYTPCYIKRVFFQPLRTLNFGRLFLPGGIWASASASFVMSVPQVLATCDIHLWWQVMGQSEHFTPCLMRPKINCPQWEQNVGRRKVVLLNLWGMLTERDVEPEETEARFFWHLVITLLIRVNPGAAEKNVVRGMQFATKWSRTF